MQYYISQLIEDILAAKRPANTIKPIEKEDSLKVNNAEIEQFLNGDAKQVLRNLLRLEEIQFPPIERLTDEQMASVVLAFNECLFSWNILADMPDNIPVSLKYNLLVSSLAWNVIVQDSGFGNMMLYNYES